MNLSMNEVAAQAKKAARGAGYSWGLAEEAGLATCWLCARQIDGVGVLADLLTEAPEPESCALRQGARLSDRAMLAPSESRALHRVTQPVFYLPFIAAAARQRQVIFAMIWEGGEALTDGHALFRQGPIPTSGGHVSLELRTTMPAAPHQNSRATPGSAAWKVLSTFAHRTYAPATEESRRLGAGDSAP